MESLFKFVLERPPIQQDPNLIIELSQNSNYQALLANSIGKKDPRKVLKDASRNYTQSTKFVKDPSDLPIIDKLLAYREILDVLEIQENITQAEMKNAVLNVFGKTPSQTLNIQAFKTSLKNLRDTVVSIKHLPEEHHKPIEKLSNAIRDLEIVKMLAADKTFPGKGTVLKKYRKRVLRLPSQSDLKSILAIREEERKRREEENNKRLKDKQKSIKQKAILYGQLKTAIKEIMALDHDKLEASVQTSDRGFTPPKELQPVNIFKEELRRLNTLGELKILNAKKHIETGQNSRNIIHEKVENIDSNLFNILQNRGKFFVGAKKFEPMTALATMFRFKKGVEQSLSKETQKLLKDRNLSISEMGIDKLIAQLKFEMNNLSNELGQLTNTQKTKSMKRVGNAMIITTIPKATMWDAMSYVDVFENFDWNIIDNRVPKSKGSVSPSGIADLIIVKQQLKKYVGKDVAHIENISRGEKKVRDHRRYRQTVDESFSETEITSVEERELESTDRFEMSREASKTIKTEASLKAGLTVSGSYGPTVKFSTSVEGSLSTSKEEATKTASKFSKDVTQKSVEKLTERVLERSKLVVTNEVEEQNNHTLDNTGGTDHISGVYQWVEKVYEAQMFNYGIRMMFDFMIPEPGAYIVEAMQNAFTSSLEIEKPLKFALQPNNINDVNYNYWAHAYGAKGLTPPPEEYVTVSYNYNAGEGGEKTDFQNSGIIKIEDGYIAVQSSMGLACTQWNSDRIVDVVIGRRTHRFKDDGNWMWISNLNNETESLPLGFITNDLADIAVAIEVKCKRTSRAYQKWQLDMHAKLMEAYQTKMADYEERLAAIELQAGVEIEGKNPALNLEVMKDELKKNCISIITDQHYDLFNSIQNGLNNMPQINIYENKAEGPYVRFFEQAFEWEHITWLTYPYFWGRKNTWEEKIAYEDTDPLFNQFIKSGYCRAVIPVRPGFEGAVDHFMTFGEIWNGGPLPAISSDLYLPIADELAERLGKPGYEIPQGDPWEVRVPTNLVKLRADDKLPTWHKDTNGNWIEG